MKFLFLFMLITSFAFGGNHRAQLESLRQQGQREGWTFEVGESDVLDMAIADHTGLILDRDWHKAAKFRTPEIPVELPAKWDWREHDGVTDVKNQGSCGSCWAFGSVAALESAIKISTGKTVTLAEQQLVSCSPRFGSCQGGNFALAFYKTVGANHEEDFPYKAANVACKTTAPKYEKVATWAYVGNSRGATTAQIKAAIFKYGVVAATVSVNGAFKSYKSGVYNACSSGHVNHLVALVGWNDEDQTWLMKNSWGKNWGEEGYMRIRYTGTGGAKCNQIGAQVAFATYETGTR